MIIIVIEIMKNYGIYENSEIDLDYYSVIVILNKNIFNIFVMQKKKKKKKKSQFMSYFAIIIVGMILFGLLMLCVGDFHKMVNLLNL